jgi:hypothetical protein
MKERPVRDAAAIAVRHLRPYFSILILEITDTAARDRVFNRLLEITEESKERARHQIEVIAAGLHAPAFVGADAIFDQAHSLVWRHERVPSWASEDSPFRDIEHELSMCLRRGNLIAILAQEPVRRAIFRWMNREPRPPIRKIRPAVLNACLLNEGNAKNLWLTNVRRRSATRPDSKAISGISLISALEPIGDGSFALSSARVALPEDPTRMALNGLIGTTPRDSKVWGGPTSDITEFMTATSEMLGMIQQGIDAGVAVDNPFPLLASRVEGLAGVHGAYEFRCPPSSELIVGSEISEDQWRAAQELERVSLYANPADTQVADAILDVGYEGRLAGRLRASVREDGPGVRVTIGHEGPHTDPGAVSEILQLIDTLGEFSIHYSSGHAIIGGDLYQQRTDVAAFNGWRFEDFANYRIDKEKPASRPHDVHATVGERGDDSLFGWVAHTYREGVLLCDDGSGEVADFIYIADSGRLSLIHVKAAENTSPRRRVAVAPYEVVVSQAVKNLANLNMDQLADRLSRSAITTPAAWDHGKRVRGRAAFLDSLACRDVTDPCEVLIVQPHHSRGANDEARHASPGSDSLDLYRLKLLDTLLNAALIACIGSNAQFGVIGSA